MVACGGPNVPDSTTTPPGNFKEAFAQLEYRSRGLPAPSRKRATHKESNTDALPANLPKQAANRLSSLASIRYNHCQMPGRPWRSH